MKYLEVTPRFSTFISFLIDGLHEDLNEVLNKQWNGRCDGVVALKYTICPYCNHCSVTFETYQMLSGTKYKIIEYTWIDIERYI